MIYLEQQHIAMADLKVLDSSAISLLDYQNSDLSMVIILPRKLDSLRELHEKLTDAKLPQLLGKIVDKTCVDVELPKFTAEFKGAYQDGIFTHV